MSAIADQDSYAIESQYMAFKCLNSKIIISNIGSTNYNGIIIEEAETPRTTTHSTYFMFDTKTDDNMDNDNYYLMSEEGITNLFADLTLYPDYNVSVLPGGESKTYTSTIHEQKLFQEIPTGVNSANLTYNENFYSRNATNRTFKILQPPRTSFMIYAQTEFLLIPKPNSVKNLFTINV